MRTCASIDIDDCKPANGVTYCYCKNELCNQPGRKLSNPYPGSGLGSSPHNFDIHIVNTKHKPEGNFKSKMKQKMNLK